MTNDDQSNQAATSPTNSEAVRSGDWLGEAPGETQDSEGWWRWWAGDEPDGKWCAAVIRTHERTRRLIAYAMWPDGGCGIVSLIEEKWRWGGRLAVNGASPSVGTEVETERVKTQPED